MLPIDRLDAQGKAILAGAYHVSQRFHQAEVDPEHYLLALLEQPDSITLKILKQLAVDGQGLRAQVEALVSAKPKAQTEKVEQVFITEPAKHVLEGAVEESARLGDDMILPEHLLLAMARVGTGASAEILAAQGLTSRRIEEAIRFLRSQSV